MMVFLHTQPRRRLVLAVAISLVALVVRLPGLGTFMTADEATWMDRARLFYNYTATGQFSETILSTHPGTPTMWLAGAGIKAQEQRLGLELSEGDLLHFRKSAVLPLAAATALLTGLIAWLLVPLLGAGAAGLGGLLLAVDPYLVGSSQIVHLDALQSLLMLAATLAFSNAVGKDTSRRTAIGYWMLTGLLSGLAAANRLAFALPLLPLFVAILLVHHRHSLKQNWQTIIARLGFITGIATLVVYATWPVLWVYDDVARSVIRDVNTAITDAHVEFDVVEGGINPRTFYLRTLLARVPIYTQILTLGALALVAVGIRQWWSHRSNVTTARAGPRNGGEGQVSKANSGVVESNVKSQMSSVTIPATILWLIVYSLGFLLLITLAAKKADRYALPAITAFPILAGWTAATLLQHFSSMPHARQYARALTTILLIAAFIVPLTWSPYAIAYHNVLLPDLRPLSQQGWGEGLDAAARWLNEQPLAERLTVASWYQTVLDTYFDGTALRLASRDDYRVSHIITYRNMQGRAGDTLASDVLDELVDQEPVHIVSIYGEPYAWIYATDSVGLYLNHVGEILPRQEVGQLLIPASDSWDSVEIGFATFARQNSPSVIVSIYDDIKATTPLRTVTLRAADFADNSWHAVNFAPLTVTPGQEYYVAVTSPNAAPGNAITIRYVNADIFPGAMVLIKEPRSPGQSRVDFIRETDAAIRIPD